MILENHAYIVKNHITNIYGLILYIIKKLYIKDKKCYTCYVINSEKFFKDRLDQELITYSTLLYPLIIIIDYGDLDTLLKPYNMKIYDITRLKNNIDKTKKLINIDSRFLEIPKNKYKQKGIINI